MRIVDGVVNVGLWGNSDSLLAAELRGTCFGGGMGRVDVGKVRGAIGRCGFAAPNDGRERRVGKLLIMRRWEFMESKTGSRVF